MSTIDYDFISKIEGGQRLDATMPGGNGGVRVATGFDLGKHDEKELKALKLPDDLVAKLGPYLGQKGKDAASVLKEKPLKIEKKEADLIDKVWRDATEKDIVARYNQEVQGRGGTWKFDDLLTEAQTVIYSVRFQYPDLKGQAPKFWEAIVKGDLYGAVDELRDFKDKHPKRRNQEADLLSRGLSNKKSSNEKQNPGPPPPTPKDWDKAAMGTDATRCFPLGKGWTGQDYHNGPMSFGAGRDGNGRPPRAHAACDLAAPTGTPIYAVADGKVIKEAYWFLDGTYALEVEHDNGAFTVRYGEILKGSAPLKKGDPVFKGKVIAKVGHVANPDDKDKMPMLHFEMYTGQAEGELTDHNPKTSAKRKDNALFHRRKDLVNPTPFLDAWKKNRPG